MTVIKKVLDDAFCGSWQIVSQRVGRISKAALCGEYCAEQGVYSRSSLCATLLQFSEPIILLRFNHSNRDNLALLISRQCGYTCSTYG